MFETALQRTGLMSYRNSATRTSEIYFHNEVLIRAIGYNELRRADLVEAMPKIEADCRAIFGIDLQPGTFAAYAPAMIQGAT